MKKVILLVLTILMVTRLLGQDITGSWNGILDVQGTQLRLVFNISKTENTLKATMDSPDQGAKEIPCTAVSFEEGTLKIAVAAAGIKYEGKLENDKAIKGTFMQGGLKLPLNLSKEKVEKTTKAKPQEPSKPYPYYTEDVVFNNEKDKLTLAGTLSLPTKEGNYPVVVLISGSGPQNRDEELLGHKPFLIIADYLTKNGIGVLRYDDRGTAESKGNFQTATSKDFASDVEAAVAYLKTRKEVNAKKIGLVGHSEGGLIAPMVAAKSKDVSIIVLLAGTGIVGDELLLLQMELIARATGESETNIISTLNMSKEVFKMAKKTNDTEVLKKEITNYIQEKLKENPDMKPKSMTDEAFIKAQVGAFANPWMQYFLAYDPASSLKQVKCPVLALNGEKDLQVPPKINLDAIKKNLEMAKNKNVKTMELPGLNHLFQECKTGSPEEYAKIEQTFSPLALNEITAWILNQVK
jgi:uncharacterized protein